MELINWIWFAGAIASAATLGIADGTARNIQPLEYAHESSRNRRGAPQPNGQPGRVWIERRLRPSQPLLVWN